jgi:hypothetical protein
MATTSALRLAQRRVDDVRLHAEHFRGAAASLAHDAGRVALVHQQVRVRKFLRQPLQLVQSRHVAVHAEHAVRHDESDLRVRPLRHARRLCRRHRLRQLLLQIYVVQVLEALLRLRLAQADAVDDAGVVQLVAEDRVPLAQQRLEDPRVRVEARPVQDRVLRAVERGKSPLQVLVDVLGAADESHRGQTEPVRVQRVLGRLHQARVVRQTKVVVSTKVHKLAGRPGR